MTKRMLIDANHPEETRAVVLDNQHLVEFDFESSTKRQLKGNIYLAKITRVEPSLQAAFVDYGGNRHGFLAFSEIHSDYYQIPQADREFLAQAERDAQVKADHEASAHAAKHETNGHAEGDAEAEAVEVSTDADEETADMVDEQARRRARLLRSYKIQEVIKRRQIMLVQVVKEERGNKGAALTTYLSLAGRYCVLMPNTARGGGISRKIASGVDRRRLKDIAVELEVPQGMGLIIRTAGQERSKAEIKRDYDYLLRLWSEIRDTTLQSIAPKLIYEEGDIIKRAMRDIYSRDIEEILVEGEESYKSAKRLMTMLMPSKARIVKLYKEDTPLFFHYKVEDQLDAMHSPVVQLASGGSIVIHTTEALTAVDVNSGRSTRERHIDETAVKTNLEAADEIARQLRLRDLAGLVVIDFIDMAESRHQRSVERRLRDALKSDRARLQVGKISIFGLLELSRQRLRPSLQELSSQVCPACAGVGVIRSTESCALQALRRIQEEGMKGTAEALELDLPSEVALYVLNQKREGLIRLEQRYQMRVLIRADSTLMPPHMHLAVTEQREAEPEAVVIEDQPVERAPVEAERPRERPPERERGRAPERERTPERERQAERPQEPERVAAPTGGGEEGEEGAGKRRRRRRRRRRRGGEAGEGLGAPMNGQAEDQAFEGQPGDEPDDADEDADAAAEAPAMASEPEPQSFVETEAAPDFVPEPVPVAESPVIEEPQGEAEVPEPVAEAAPTEAEAAPADGEAPKKRRARRPAAKPRAKSKKALAAEAAAAEATAEAPPAPDFDVQPTPSFLAEEVPAPLAIEPAAEPDTADLEPAGEVAPAADAEPEEQKEPAEPAMASEDGEGEAARPARQGWWSRWVR